MGATGCLRHRMRVQRRLGLYLRLPGAPPRRLVGEAKAGMNLYTELMQGALCCSVYTNAVEASDLCVTRRTHMRLERIPTTFVGNKEINSIAIGTAP